MIAHQPPAIAAATAVIAAVLVGTAVAQHPSPAPETAVSAPSPAPPPSLRETLNSLDPAQIDAALEAIQSRFVAPGMVDEGARKRALLEGFARRLAPGIEILPPHPGPQSEPPPFLAEILDDRAGYLRIGKLDSPTLAQFDTSLKNFAAKPVAGVILDLRGVDGGGDFGMAADFARRLCPAGNVLFSIQKPAAKQERIVTADSTPLHSGILIVLTDSQTSGAAEVLAATLRANARAVIVGADTRGRAVEFADQPLGGGISLRVAVAQAVLPDGSCPFPHGVKPDVPVSLAPGELESIHAATREKGISEFVFDSPRERFNEAALVAHTNPEIAAPGDSPAPSPVRDTVLQRAMDLVMAIEIFRNQPAGSPSRP